MQDRLWILCNSVESSLIGFQILHGNQPLRNYHLLGFVVVSQIIHYLKSIVKVHNWIILVDICGCFSKNEQLVFPNIDLVIAYFNGTEILK